MNLNEIKKSEVVLLDANILIYGILDKSEQCARLLRRCTSKDVIGVIGLPHFAEVMHRLMMFEARENEWVSGGNPVKMLSERPERVRVMTRYADAIKGLLASGFSFEPTVKEDFFSALSFQRQYGMMTNDALLAALADRMRIQAIASADRTFANLHGVILYTPDDL